MYLFLHKPSRRIRILFFIILLIFLSCKNHDFCLGENFTEGKGCTQIIGDFFLLGELPLFYKKLTFQDRKTLVLYHEGEPFGKDSFHISSCENELKWSGYRKGESWEVVFSYLGDLIFKDNMKSLEWRPEPCQKKMEIKVEKNGTLEFHKILQIQWVEKNLSK